jgi:hypothetical protein
VFELSVLCLLEFAYLMLVLKLNSRNRLQYLGSITVGTSCIWRISGCLVTRSWHFSVGLLYSNSHKVMGNFDDTGSGRAICTYRVGAI